jgi:hypothetical protein
MNWLRIHRSVRAAVIPDATAQLKPNDSVEESELELGTAAGVHRPAFGR